MPHTVLITTHPGAALAKACMRGRWVPLLLLVAQAPAHRLGPIPQPSR
jgi:hypothetical protein